jgi:hypothetical protein
MHRIRPRPARRPSTGDGFSESPLRLSEKCARHSGRGLDYHAVAEPADVPSSRARRGTTSAAAAPLFRSSEPPPAFGSSLEASTRHFAWASGLAYFFLALSDLIAPSIAWGMSPDTRSPRAHWSAFRSVVRASFASLVRRPREKARNAFCDSEQMDRTAGCREPRMAQSYASSRRARSSAKKHCCALVTRP